MSGLFLLNGGQGEGYAMKEMLTARELGKSNLLVSIMGDADRCVTKVSSLEDAGSDSVVFVSNEKSEDLIRDSRAGIVVCNRRLLFKDKTLLITPDPRVLIKEIIEKYFIPKEAAGKFMPDGSYVYPNVKIGKNVTVRAGSVLGGAGYGYIEDNRDEFTPFPQIGGVIIEDDVEIGCNAAIDRGALGNTVIGQGTRVDNLVHIAHSVKIGKHCAIVAQVGIYGSVTIGDYTWIAPHATVDAWLKIGSRVIIGLGAVVRKDVPDNAIMVGNPARQIGENIPFKRIP